MIRKHAFSVVYVLDQDRAKAFYTEKLGFELRSDQNMGEYRWLTVGAKDQPDAAIALSRAEGGLRELVERGVLVGGVLVTDDCRGTYEQLKARGVHFDRGPTPMPFGLEAQLRDDSGNVFSLVQPKHP